MFLHLLLFFARVFSHAPLRDVFAAEPRYQAWVFVFALLALPLALLDAKEQATFQVPCHAEFGARFLLGMDSEVVFSILPCLDCFPQVAMTGLRFVVIAAMVASVAIAAWDDAAAAAATAAATAGGDSGGYHHDVDIGGGAALLSVGARGAGPYRGYSDPTAFWFGEEQAQLRRAAGPAPLVQWDGVFAAFSVMVRLEEPAAWVFRCGSRACVRVRVRSSPPPPPPPTLQVFAQQMNIRMGVLAGSVAKKADLAPCVAQAMSAACFLYLVFSLSIGLYFGEAVSETPKRASC